VVPEEPYDGRSLYERLKEQRDAKDHEFEESRKFKNMIRGLDDDEIDHLSEIDNR
jgi:FAM192A/Fyv6, N-terminal domain